jgi:hypothetical protein
LPFGWDDSLVMQGFDASYAWHEQDQKEGEPYTIESSVADEAHLEAQALPSPFELCAQIQSLGQLPVVSVQDTAAACLLQLSPWVHQMVAALSTTATGTTQAMELQLRGAGLEGLRVQLTLAQGGHLSVAFETEDEKLRKFLAHRQEDLKQALQRLRGIQDVQVALPGGTLPSSLQPLSPA